MLELQKFFAIIECHNQGTGGDIRPGDVELRLSCEEWKAAIVFTAETVGTELIESTRELTYCPQCGATLLLEQS